jgi:vacuolar protein sorting-associated protein 35
VQNFVESNRLWVRLQLGGSKDKKKREKERQDLRILVGINLVRLSQLEGLDVGEYKTNVLPSVLEEVVGCKDTIAQSYLMDCIIQVFPDEFHLATLELFLKSCLQLKEKVNVRSILESLMDRLASYAAAHTGGGAAPATSLVGAAGGPLAELGSSFKKLNDSISTLIDERSNISLTEILRLQTALTSYALKCFPGRMDYVSHCLVLSTAMIEKTDFVAAANSSGGAAALSDGVYADTTAQIEALLSAPLASLALRVLEMPAYGKLMSYLPWSNWREVAVSLLRAVIGNPAKSPLAEVSQVEQLLGMLTPLIKDRDRDREGPAAAGLDAAALSRFKEEQHLMARLPHLVHCEDSDATLQIFFALRAAFAGGGASRMQFTFPPLVFAALALARRVFRREKQVCACLFLIAALTCLHRRMERGWGRPSTAPGRSSTS